MKMPRVILIQFLYLMDQNGLKVSILKLMLVGGVTEKQFFFNKIYFIVIDDEEATFNPG